MDLTSDNSSEDDEDIYVRSAARLKGDEYIFKTPTNKTRLDIKRTKKKNNNDDDDDDDNSIALKKKAPLVVNDDHSPTVKEQETNNHIPDFWSSERSGSRKTKNSRTSCFEPSNDEKSPNVEITVKDDDLPIFERSLDSSDCRTAGLGTEDDNYKMDVKVKWKSRETVRLELRKYESFDKVFKHFAATEGVSERKIIILKGNRQINKADTPASVNLKIIDILEGGVVNTDVVTEERDIEDSTCKIKVQMSTKQRIVVDVKMSETFKSVVLICAEKLNVEPSRVKLSLDGEEIALTDTPESLDLEQEACIDLRLITPSI